VRLVAWSPQSSLLVSIGEAESDQGGDHQFLLWSWPQAERLTGGLCARGILDLAFAPDSFVFATLNAKAVKRWSVVQPPEPAASRRKRAPPQLVGRVLPKGLFGRAGGSHEGRERRWSVQDGFMATIWGTASTLYVITGQGLLFSITIDDQKSNMRDMGQKALALAWSAELCGTQPVGGMGFLLCAFASGTVQVVDGATLCPAMALPVPPGAPAALGVSCCPGGESLWVLYSDHSLQRWRELREGPDWSLPRPLSGLRDAHFIPGCCLPQVVTITDRFLQLWTATPDGLRMEAQKEPGTARSGELTALACSPWIAACGHSSGEINLLTLPGLVAMAPTPARHAGEVLALSFAPWRPVSGAPLLLASGSSDRGALVFRIDVRRGAVGVEASQASLLLQLPKHPAAVQCVALVSSGHAPERAAQLAVCTADRAMLIRDLDLGAKDATVRRSHRHVARGTHWIGVCAHPAKPVFFAALADRRILELDSEARVVQQVRPGGSEFELVAPLRLNGDGRLLAVGLAGGAPPLLGPGALLLETGPALRPLARLTGHAELSSGITFLHGDRVIGCWRDGAMLIWEASEQDVPIRDDHAERSPLGRRPPRPHSVGLEMHRCPDGLLERLLASSPKPPRWAGGGGSASSSFRDDRGRTGSGGTSSSVLLGKWARGSLVGAQVRSASDLHAASRDESSICEDPAPPRGGGCGAGGCDAATARVRAASESAITRGSEHVHRHAEARGKHPWRRSEGVHRGSMPRPLPPKPCFPPPPPAEAGGELQLQPAPPSASAGEGMPAGDQLPPGSPIRRIATPCRSGGLSPLCQSPIPADPPTRDADGSEVAPSPIGARGLRPELELASPRATTEAAEKPVPPGQFDAAMKELQSGIQRLCDNAVRVLQPCPEAMEVRELLSRAGALLHPDPLSRSIRSNA